jgi:hypothetical protein
MSIRDHSTKGPNPTLNSYMIGHIAHETGICRNPQIHNFTINGENVADPQKTNTYACYILKEKNITSSDFLWIQKVCL